MADTLRQRLKKTISEFIDHNKEFDMPGDFYDLCTLVEKDSLLDPGDSKRMAYDIAGELYGEMDDKARTYMDQMPGNYYPCGLPDFRASVSPDGAVSSAPKCCG